MQNPVYISVRGPHLYIGFLIYLAVGFCPAEIRITVPSNSWLHNSIRRAHLSVAHSLILKLIYISSCHLNVTDLKYT